MESNQHELLVTIINRGFSEIVMDAARKCGATGGTILHGRGAGAEEIAQFYNLIIEAEKELILIVVPKDKRNAVMDGIMHAAGLRSEAHGITFTLPIEDFTMLTKTHEANSDEDN